MRILTLAALLLASAAPALAHAQTAKVAPVLTTPEAKDVWTYARPAEARVTHVDLNLKVDFEGKKIGGVATLDVLAAKDAKEIVLDTLDLDIAVVTDARGVKLAHKVGPSDPQLGAPLTIELNGAQRIRIVYRSKPGARALQWLTPAQTQSKTLPFLFSQGQAINNRSWIPTQDSPGIRQTWAATVTVPEGFVPVMSAQMLDGATGSPAPQGRRSFRFKMDNPVPPYLIAIAIGDLKFKEIGPRSGVWAEAGMIDAAVSEFADVEKMSTRRRRSTVPIAGAATTCSCCRRPFPMAGWRTPI